MPSKEKIESLYTKIKSQDKIETEDKCKLKICRLYTVMNNFEDKLCEEMQEDVAEIKDYIKQLEAKKKEVIEKLKERKRELEHKSGGNTYHVQSIINAEKREVDSILEIMKGE